MDRELPKQVGQALSKQAELLDKVRSGVADVAQSRQRVEEQMADLARQMGKLQMLAPRARQLGREDLAQEALLKRDVAGMQLAQLKEQYEQLLAEETKLIAAMQRLEENVNASKLAI
jgi:phage shock protein A